MSKCKSWLKIVSMLIVISVVVGAIPLFKVSADSVETSSANLKVTYTQVSSWGSTVQAKERCSKLIKLMDKMYLEIEKIPMEPTDV